MSEELKKNVFSIFAQAQMTFEEAEEKAKQEAGRPKVERFRTGEDGEYMVRILPLAPNFDSEGNMLPMERKGYEYPIHQLFLSIALPSKPGKKSKKISIPVVRTTDKGIDKSVDLIDTYVKIAKEMYQEDADLLDVITGGSYGGGLRWTYQHAMMVLDLTSDKERAKGPQLWQCSNSQYNDIEGAKLRLWRELRDDDIKQSCPISSLQGAYPIKIIRKTDKKTEYRIEIGRKVVDPTEDEATKLLELPRIPEMINRFTRYQFEAEVYFLKQYDELHQIDVCSQSDFLDAVETLKGELSPDDNSHFDIAKSGTDARQTTEVTIDSLWAEYDKIAEEGLSERSEEYQDLREKIRQFAEDKQLDVRLARSKNNKQLLEEIEEALDDAKSQPADEESKKPVEQPKEEDEDEEAEPPVEEAPRRRRPRPVEDYDAEEAQKEEPKEQAEEQEAQPEETGRRLHRRRR